METSAYVKYSMKRLHMEDGAKLFVYLVLNKVNYTPLTTISVISNIASRVRSRKLAAKFQVKLVL